MLYTAGELTLDDCKPSACACRIPRPTDTERSTSVSCFLLNCRTGSLARIPTLSPHSSHDMTLLSTSEFGLGPPPKTSKGIRKRPEGRGLSNPSAPKQTSNKAGETPIKRISLDRGVAQLANALTVTDFTFFWGNYGVRSCLPRKVTLTLYMWGKELLWEISWWFVRWAW